MEWLEKVRANPAVAHWLRAFGRFGSRLGAQFAAAITYFSVLSMVPILMVAFAVVGLTVTVFFPDILDTIRAAITDAVASDASLGQQMTALVDQAFNSWQAVGTVGLLSAIWAGSVWVSHTRNAVRAMVREDFDDISAEPHPVVAVVQNIALLFALLLLLGVTAAMSTVATPARGLGMAEVEARFGAPQQKLDPRGGQKRQWPAIHRWVYPEFVVYFEKNKVIDVVARQASAAEAGPKPPIR